MGWLSRLVRGGQGEPDLHVGDPRFDGWEVLRSFDDLHSARAWRQHLQEAGIEAVLTADWPLDRFKRGDIMLQVPPEKWSEAEELLSGLTELE
jgi:hypothetical protein